jgi:hypothetical protein
MTIRTTWQLFRARTASTAAVSGVLAAVVLSPTFLSAQAELIPATALNPRPHIDSFDPMPVEVVAGGERLVTVKGASFVDGAVVYVDGEARTTMFADERTLRFISPTRDRDRGRVLAITGLNPEPGGGESEPRGLPVEYPEPSLGVFDPPALVRDQSPPVQVVLRGSKLLPDTRAVVNGVERSTVYGSPQSVRLTLTSEDLQSGPAIGIAVRNPAPGGGESGTLQLPILNLAPTVTGVDPSVLEPPASGNRLRITGTGFVLFTSGFGDGSVVRWNGAVRATSYVSRTELQVTLLPEDIQTPGTSRLRVVNPEPGGGSSADIWVEFREAATNPVPELAGGYWGGGRTFLEFWVTNPPPGGGASNALRLEILNPVPRIDAVEPASLEAGTNGSLLRVSGAGFLPRWDFDPPSTVRWNGRDLETTLEAENTLRAFVPPGLAQTRRGDRFTVTVWNPPPGGGTSAGTEVTVER